MIKQNRYIALNADYFYDLYTKESIPANYLDRNISNNVIIKEHNGNKYYLPLILNSDEYSLLQSPINVKMLLNYDKDNQIYHNEYYNKIKEENETTLAKYFYKNLFNPDCEEAFKAKLKKDIKIDYNIDLEELNIEDFEGDNINLSNYSGKLIIYYNKEKNNKKFNIITPKTTIWLDSDYDKDYDKKYKIEINIGTLDCKHINWSSLDFDDYILNIDKLIFRGDDLNLDQGYGYKYKVHIKELYIASTEFVENDLKELIKNKKIIINKITGNTEYLLNFDKKIKSPNLIKNKTFVIANKWLLNMSKESLEKLILKSGGKVKTNIDNTVDYLISYTLSGTSKYRTAIQLGIKIIHPSIIKNWLKGINKW